MAATALFHMGTTAPGGLFLVLRVLGTRLTVEDGNVTPDGVGCYDAEAH